MLELRLDRGVSSSGLLGCLWRETLFDGVLLNPISQRSPLRLAFSLLPAEGTVSLTLLLSATQPVPCIPGASAFCYCFEDLRQDRRP